MRVYTFENTGPALVGNDQLNVPSGGPRMGWAEEVPTSGYWKVGDKLTIGSVDYVCTAEGSPGTWAPSGGGGGGGVPIDAAVRILYDGTPSRIMGNIASVVPQGVEPGQYQVNFITPYADDEHYVVLLTTSNVNALATVGGYNPDNFLISCINPADGSAVASQINVVVINTPPV